MNDPLIITIFIALIVSAIAAIFMIAVQVAIFVLIQKNNFNFSRYFVAIKNFFINKVNFLLNPASKINKTKRI
jgi:multidrug efflux pump subunit AcrB